MIDIKTPPCYDVSHWKEIVDFQAVNPRPLLFITKATEAAPNTGWNHTDEKFPRFFEGMEQIGVHRGVYHFFRQSVDAVKQAEHFCRVIYPHVADTDILILDVEEGGEKASQLWAWFKTVQGHYPRSLLMIYSRANILNAIQMTEGEKEYFKKIPVWTAGYPDFPNLWSIPLSGYIPDRSKWGPLWLWQYSAKGRVTGIDGDVDLNWMSPELIAHLGIPPSHDGENPTGAIMEYKVIWRDGVTRRKGPTTSAERVLVNGLPVILPAGLVFDVVQDGIADQTYPNDPNKRWVKFTDGTFGASDYPDSDSPEVRMVKVVETQPPASEPPRDAVVTMPDGSKWRAGTWTKI